MSHSPMVIAAARELCKRVCESSKFEFEPWWATYRNEYLADAQAVFDAAGVGDLVEALHALYARHGDDNEHMWAEWDAARATLTRATGV